MHISQISQFYVNHKSGYLKQFTITIDIIYNVCNKEIDETKVKFVDLLRR